MMWPRRLRCCTRQHQPASVGRSTGAVPQPPGFDVDERARAGRDPLIRGRSSASRFGFAQGERQPHLYPAELPFLLPDGSVLKGKKAGGGPGNLLDPALAAAAVNDIIVSANIGVTPLAPPASAAFKPVPAIASAGGPGSWAS